MSDNLLYLKFLLDPIVYAWRMPNYRDSFGKYIVTTKISAGRASWPELRDQQLNWTNRQ